jgi:transcription initiation factor IIE alpha subunit
MREWHIQHMEKTVIKYITGLTENATAWEKRQHRRYGGITRVYRQINYDIKHGVTNEEVLELLDAIKNDSSYLNLRNDTNCMNRLAEIESLFVHATQSLASPRFIVE